MFVAFNWCCCLCLTWLAGRIENNNAYILKRYSEFEELHDTLKRNLPVIFSYFSSDRHSVHSILSSHSTLAPKTVLARFHTAFLDCRRKLLQLGLQVFCCILSWVGETTCGFGY